MRLKLWYQSKSDKDKRAILVLAVFLVFSSVFFLWHSLKNQQTLLLEEVNYYRELNTWIGQNKSQVLSARRNVSKSVSGSIFSNIEQTFLSFSSEGEGHKVEIRTLSNNQVSVNIKQVAFNHILEKINSLNQKHIFVERFEVEKIDKPGWVKVYIVFSF